MLVLTVVMSTCVYNVHTCIYMYVLIYCACTCTCDMYEQVCVPCEQFKPSWPLCFAVVAAK